MKKMTEKRMNEKEYIKRACRRFKSDLDDVNKLKNIDRFFRLDHEHNGIAIGALYVYGEETYDIICRMNRAYNDLGWKNFI